MASNGPGRKPRKDDPAKLVRFMARHAINGIAAGWVFLLALLRLDIGGLGSMIDRSEQGELVTVMLAGAFAVTFGGLGLTWGVLVGLPRER